MKVKEFICFGEIHETAIKKLTKEINVFIESAYISKIINISHSVTHVTNEKENIIAATALLCYEG